MYDFEKQLAPQEKNNVNSVEQKLAHDWRHDPLNAARAYLSSDRRDEGDPAEAARDKAVFRQMQAADNLKIDTTDGIIFTKDAAQDIRALRAADPKYPDLPQLDLIQKDLDKLAIKSVTEKAENGDLAPYLELSKDLSHDQQVALLSKIATINDSDRKLNPNVTKLNIDITDTGAGLGYQHLGK